MPRPPRPRSPAASTIYDLAQLAGTSPSTVSAILNGTWRARRVGEDTAERVLALAREHRYSVNRQARGLRQQRSGLIGMIVPMHDNRFFSALSQTFEEEARRRHRYPLVVSTLRRPSVEQETVRALLGYRIEALLVTGATDPDAVARICADHGVRQVNVDLPGTLAPSVISDNRWGAEQLTARLLDARASPAGGELVFLGGIESDHSTRERMAGFRAVHAARGIAVAPDQIDPCGYEADQAATALAARVARAGHLPAGLFVNSTIALEGVVRFLATLPLEDVRRCAIGSYDWDPFAASLAFALPMVRQDTRALIAQAFAWLDGELPAPGTIATIRPQLIEPDREGSRMIPS